MSGFYDTAAFAFAAELELHWQRIRDEYLEVASELVDWVERDLYNDDGWQVYGLYSFPYGLPISPNINRCPFTSELITKHIPRHGAAGFSRLRPGTRIQPHTGFPGEFLRCHLGLDIPPGDCQLLVDGEARHWTNGKTMIFDDRVTHSAWNRTSEGRVVLLVDFVP